MTKLQILGAVAAAALAACDGQAGPDYPGEPLATIRGTVLANVAVRSGPLDVILFWIPFEDDVDEPVAQRVAVSGEFPAAFKLDLFEPPPPEGYIFPGDPEIGFPGFAQAIIIAVPQGLQQDEEPVPGTVFGMSDLYQVLYLDGDIAEGSPLEPWWGGPFTKGYHVGVRCAPEDPDLDDSYCPAPDGLDTDIVIELEVVE